MKTIAEEIQDASITLAKAIMWPVIPNAVMGFIMSITLIFTMGDINNILATPTFEPFIQVFYNATGSYAATNVTPDWNIPLRAVFVSLVVSYLISLINLGSSVALNAINSLGSVAILSSYFITISCLIAKRFSGQPLPQRRWSLGKFGLAINIAALLS
ncbi:hypothetical protein B7463_g2074, partial [Scytalidium lignicola]